MLNKKISKGSTKTLFYRDYKKFEENKFARDLTQELQNIKNLSYRQFEKAYVTNIKSKEIFEWNSFAKQNKTTSIIWILKNSGKRLNLISVTKD